MLYALMVSYFYGKKGYLTLKLVFLTVISVSGGDIYKV